MESPKNSARGSGFLFPLLLWTANSTLHNGFSVDAAVLQASEAGPRYFFGVSSCHYVTATVVAKSMQRHAVLPTDIPGTHTNTAVDPSPTNDNRFVVPFAFLQIRSAVSDYDAGVGGKKKKKKKGSSKKQAPPADAAPADKKAIAKAAAAKNKKANEKKAAAAEKKKKTALSLPDDDEEEIDLVAKMEAARRAMPNACVVRGKEKK